MEYKISVPFTGSTSAAIGIARAQFIANGFKVAQSGETELTATGPGMQSTNQNSILGVSRARITFCANSIELCAELGGVKFMQGFLYVFPSALVCLLAIVFLLTSSNPRHILLISVIIVLPWLVISPLMARWIKTRTTNALDTLAYNMAQVRS